MFSGRGTALDQFRCSALLILGSGAVGLKPLFRSARLCEYLAERRLGCDPDPPRSGDENPSRSSAASMTPATTFHAARMNTPMTISIRAVPQERCRTRVETSPPGLGTEWLRLLQSACEAGIPKGGPTKAYRRIRIREVKAFRCAAGALQGSPARFFMRRRLRQRPDPTRLRDCWPPPFRH